MSPSYCFFRSATLSAMPSRIIVVFSHPAVSSVFDKTYLGMVFIRTSNSPAPSIVGHARAKPSDLTRRCLRYRLQSNRSPRMVA